MIETLEEFNEVLSRLKKHETENKLGPHMQSKLDSFLEVEKLINDLSLGGVTKRLFHFDYVARTYLSEFNRVGEVATEYIKAYDKEHAILLFKEKHGDTPYDPPY